jgi:hypothetical protein
MGARGRQGFAVVLLLLVADLLPAAASGQIITARGWALDRVLDSLQVGRYWRPGDPVDWRTGAYEPNAVSLKSHCSAFVAAACARFGVYILRPPEHSEALLANAQCDWLEGEGRNAGWRRVDGGAAAQDLANQGVIVVVCWRNPDRDDSGHIAIIRPSTKSHAGIARDGPDIAQAGADNYSRTSLKIGFKHHWRAGKRGKILYYAHRVS